MVRRVKRPAPARKCVVWRCERNVAKGKVVCAPHMRMPEGRETQQAVERLAGDITMAAAMAKPGGRWEEETMGKFRQRIERGEYGSLLEKPLRAVVLQAAAERSLDEEIGALRIAAKRMLMEEEDPARMALGLSRVTMALGRLVKQEQELAERRDRAAWESAGQAFTLRSLFAERGAGNEERGTGGAPESGDGVNAGPVDAEGQDDTGPDERDEEPAKRRTNRQVVEEWRAQGGEARGPRMEGRVVQAEDEDGIIDAFSEMRSGYWDQFPEVDG